MRSLSIKYSLFTVMLVSTLISALGQVEKQGQPTKMDRSSQLPATPVIDPRNKGVLIEASEDYRLSPGDVLDVQIEDAPEFSKVYRVNASGAFSLPPFGSINCQGQTAEMLAQQLEKLLRENDYLKVPQVTILVKQYNSQTFYVHGEVRQPGVYQVEGRPSLLKLIGLAGGFTEKHGSTIFLLRPERKSENKIADATTQITPSLATASIETLSKTQSYSSTEKVFADSEAQSNYSLDKIRISDLLRGEPKYNPRVDPDAVVYIPEADVFYVGGEVMSPGSFPIKEGATLRQAISLAKGFTPKANPTKGIVFREKPGTSQREEIKINIKEIMDGKQQDLALLPNDIIVLPDSKLKAFTSAFLSTLPSGAAVALGQVPFIFR